MSEDVANIIHKEMVSLTDSWDERGYPVNMQLSQVSSTLWYLVGESILPCRLDEFMTGFERYMRGYLSLRWGEDCRGKMGENND